MLRDHMPLTPTQNYTNKMPKIIKEKVISFLKSALFFGSLLYSINFLLAFLTAEQYINSSSTTILSIACMVIISLARCNIVKSNPIHTALIIMANLIAATGLANNNKELFFAFLLFNMIVVASLFAHSFQVSTDFPRKKLRPLKVLAEYASFASILTAFISISKTMEEITKDANISKITAFAIIFIAIIMAMLAITLKISIAIEEYEAGVVSEIGKNQESLLECIESIRQEKNINSVDLDIIMRIAETECSKEKEGRSVARMQMLDKFGQMHIAKIILERNRDIIETPSEINNKESRKKALEQYKKLLNYTDTSEWEGVIFKGVFLK